MKTWHKILLGGLTIGGLVGLYFYFKLKDEHKLDDKKTNDDKNKIVPESKPTTSNASGIKSENNELVIEDPTPISNSKNVVTTCSAKVYKTLVDDKKVVSLGAVITEVKGNTRLGEFVKNVFINSTYPYVLVKMDNGDEILVNKTYTKIV